MRSLLLFLFLLALTAHAATRPTPPLGIADIGVPAGASATGASLTTSPEGVAWLSWLEREGRNTTLLFSTFDLRTRKWRAARTVAQGENWFVNWADFPAFTVGANGHATAVWFVNNPEPAATAGAVTHDHHGPGYRAFIRRTTDGGETWSEPAALTRESDSVEFVSLATLADGRVLAAWLDGRGKRIGGKAQQLYSRILDSSEPDTLVDASVCDCCQTTLTAFQDGTALLAYRGRSDEEIRDIRVTRFRAGKWDEPRALHRDNWKIPGCPVNGPQLASEGGRVAVAWFTAAEEKARVLASMSPDAGGRFLLPVQINHTKPAGRVATVLLRDGASLVSWVDTDGAVWLRRLTPDFVPTEPVPLAPAQSGRTKGFPRMTLVRDYAGGKTEAQLLVSFTRDQAPALRTLLVTVPEGALLEAEKNCECAPSPEQLRGYPVRGTIAEVLASRSLVQVQHPEVPGVLAAGTREFAVAPALLAALKPGVQFLGRVERVEGTWRLFDVRLLSAAR